MRSFAGLYFAVRMMLLASNSIASVLLISQNDPFDPSYRNVVVCSSTLLSNLRLLLVVNITHIATLIDSCEHH